MVHNKSKESACLKRKFSIPIIVIVFLSQHMVKVSQLGLKEDIICLVCKRVLLSEEEVFRTTRDGDISYLCVETVGDYEYNFEDSDDEREPRSHAYVDVACIKKYSQWVAKRNNTMLLASPIPSYLEGVRLSNAITLPQLMKTV